MKRKILLGWLLVLSMGAGAQGDTRVASGTPLRWSQEGSIEVMPGSLARHYGRNDTANALTRSRNQMARNVVTSNANATRFSSVQAQCNSNNTMAVNWVAIQHSGADRYELEQSTDGVNWAVVGVVLAHQSDRGASDYSFTYNRDVANSVFRIAAKAVSGERVYSAPFEAPCSSESYLGIMPNPVYSTTTLRIGSAGTARVKLLVVDARGSALYGTDATLTQGINHVPIDMSRFPAGRYSVVVRWTNGRQEVLPLIKQ